MFNEPEGKIEELSFYFLVLAVLPKIFLILSVLNRLLMNSMISGHSIEKILPAKYLDVEWELHSNSIKGYEKIKQSALECYESQIKLFGIKTLKRFFERYYNNWDNSELFLQAKAI